MLAMEEPMLKEALTKYKNPEKTRKDINEVTNTYRSLTSRYEPFVFNDGTQKELVNMQGTIPVEYKGSTYHFPVVLWLMDTHPHNAPLCFVRPTSDMCIKVSMFVDHNGKVYLPYLHDWQPNSSDLLGLIQVMIITFSEHPPVYAKPKPESSTPYPTNSFMPQPGGPSSYLPYPPSSTYPSSSTPYPPYPAGNGPFPSYPNIGGAYPPYPSGGATPYPPAPNPSTNAPYPPFTPTASQRNPGFGQYGQTGTITEEHIRASLLSAVEDKVRRRLREQFAQNQAELETLRRTQIELTDGRSRLEEIFTKLQREQVELDKSISVLQDKESELQSSLAKLQDEEGIDVDEAVTTTAPLYKQLLNAFAEEAATEDAIYYLDEALRKGVIDLDNFLKQVRALTRKQFTLRALMMKCRQKAGLAG